MGDIRKQRFLGALRSSPRERRKAAWLVGSAVALVAFVVVVVLILPNTAGQPKPVPANELVPPDTSAAKGSTGFWIAGSVLLIAFLSAMAYVVIRFVWRMHKDDVDDAARPGAYTFPNPRLDPERLTHPSPE